MKKFRIENKMKMVNGPVEIYKHSTGVTSILYSEAVFKNEMGELEDEHIFLTIGSHKLLSDEIAGIEIDVPVWIYFDFTQNILVTEIRKVNDRMKFRIPVSEISKWNLFIKNSEEYNREIDVIISEY